MGRFNNRIAKRWRDILKPFEAVSAQRHSREAWGFLSNVLSLSAALFPEGDRRPATWDRYCKGLATLNRKLTV